jgi:uncharacterized MnhB-related membrane protein
MKSKLNIFLYIVGIILALTAAFFMIFDILPLPARITISIVGIALIAMSPFKLLK